MCAFNEQLVATCGEDTTVRLWSLREFTNNTAKASREAEQGYNIPHHILMGHSEPVLQNFNFFQKKIRKFIEICLENV